MVKKDEMKIERSGAPVPGDAFAAACFCTLLVPAGMWAYDGRIVLAASAATFVAVYLFGRAVGLAAAVVCGMRAKKSARGIREPETV